jgi:hypothetical protein
VGSPGQQWTLVQPRRTAPQTELPIAQRTSSHTTRHTTNAFAALATDDDDDTPAVATQMRATPQDPPTSSPCHTTRPTLHSPSQSSTKTQVTSSAIANCGATPNTKISGTRRMRMNSAGYAKGWAPAPRTQPNPAWRAPTRSNPSPTTTYRTTDDIKSHTPKLSAKYARRRRTLIAPASQLGEIESATLVIAEPKQAL